MRTSLLGNHVQNLTGDLAALVILGAIYIGIGTLTLRLIERNLKKKALLTAF